MNGMRTLVLVGILTLLGVLAQAQSGSYVGHVAGSDAFVAIVADGEEVLAFVCDGEELVVWLRGAMAEDGSLTLHSATESIILEAQLDADSAQGSLTLEDGQQLTFSAATAEGEAGLYRAEETINGADYVGGWIVDPQGEQRGSVIGANMDRSTSTLNLLTLQAEVQGLGMFNPQLVTPERINATIKS